MKALAKLTLWWRVGRHVRALGRVGFVAVDTVEHRRHVADLLAFHRWANASGALNDGVPRHTRKVVVSSANRVVESVPLPWGV